MIKKYPSKVSYGLLIFVFLLFYLPLLPNLFIGEINEKTIGLIAFETVVFTFIVHLFLNTFYTIENTSLKIKCGVFSYQPIDITLIKEISKTNISPEILSFRKKRFQKIIHGK